MSLRARLTDAVKQAMKDQAAKRLSTLRLVTAAIKDKDIALRSEGRDSGTTEDEILALLGKMVKQRLEAARAYDDAGRVELAEAERGEIAVIEEFLPRQLEDAEVTAAIDEAIKSTGATTLRDMGKVIGLLKSHYTGRMDFGRVGPLVKNRLTN
ncbi:MAG: GatB/YqeY domain-containing protein [Pseudomonadota bacterium]